MKNLFNKKIWPSCEYCRMGEKCLNDDTILCIKNGVVKSSYYCKKFKYNPLKRVPKIYNYSTKFKKDDFKI